MQSARLKWLINFSTVFIQLVRKPMFSSKAFLTKALSDRFVILYQKLRVNLNPLKESGVSPVSPYIAKFGQDLGTPSMNFSSFRCTKSILQVDIFSYREVALKFCIFLSDKTNQFSTLYRSMGDM